jgi:hypothetical protein
VNQKGLFVAVITILVAVTIVGALSQKTGTQTESPKQLVEVEVEQTHIWMNYANSTQLYQYGAELTITNNRSTYIHLTNLRVAISGLGRDDTWSGLCPSADLTIPPHESKTLTVYSSDIPVTSLGFTGSATPREYLTLMLTQKNLGISVKLEGTESSSDDLSLFSMEAKGLKAGDASTEDQRIARNVTRLGLPMDWLDRWIEKYDYMPTQELFKYQPLQRGILGLAKFPYLTVQMDIFSSYSSVSLRIVDARTLTVSSSAGRGVFYLFSRGYTFDDYVNDMSLGEDGDVVYFYGDVFDYLAQTGTRYSVMFPTQVSGVEIRDPVEVAKKLLVSKVGEAYFDEYFSDPVAEYNPYGGWGNNTHYVSFNYRISVGNYSTSQPIYLYFTPDWNLTWGGDSIPVEGNLQPFKVTMEQAKEIAVMAGIPPEPYGLEANLFNFGFIPGQPSEYQGKYNWSVVTWIDPPGANPRRNMYAVIDPISGRLYAIEYGGVGYIG